MSFTRLANFRNKKKVKQQGKINSIEIKIKYLEEHEYFLDQLMAKKDMIIQEKIESIQTNMESFLIHPNNDVLREELKEEYIQMINDIHETIDIQHIEEQKQIALENAKNEELNLVKTPSMTAADPQRPKTRKELREERQRLERLRLTEQETKKEGNSPNIPLLLAESSHLHSFFAFIRAYLSCCRRTRG